MVSAQNRKSRDFARRRNSPNVTQRLFTMSRHVRGYPPIRSCCSPKDCDTMLGAISTSFGLSEDCQHTSENKGPCQSSISASGQVRRAPSADIAYYTQSVSLARTIQKRVFQTPRK